MDIFVNRCVECGVDLGSCNPRQLCGKIRCVNEPLLEEPFVVLPDGVLIKSTTSGKDTPDGKTKTEDKGK
jgi:hypothetical protein